MEVTISTEHVDSGNIEKEVEGEIQAFENWFRRWGETGPLTRAEVAILKTYFGWKMNLYK